MLYRAKPDSQGHQKPPNIEARGKKQQRHRDRQHPRAGNRQPEPVTEMTKDTYTSVSDNGLRYESKLGGSPFLGSGHTRSCFKCGKHRVPSSLQSKRVLGRTEVVCKPACNLPKEAV